MSSTINGRNYDIVDIAEWFHKLKHLDWNLQPLKNSTFDPENKDYVTSLGVFAGMPIIGLIVILVIYLLSTIIICCCCTDTKKRQNVGKGCKVFIFLFGLVCCGSFASGLYGDWKIYEGIKDVKKSTNDAIDWFDDIKNLTNEVTKVVNVRQVITDLETDVKSLNVFINTNQYIDNLETILNSVDECNKQIRKANDTIGSVDVNYVPDYIDEGGDIFCIVVLCVLLGLAIIALMFTFGICSRSCLGCLTVLAVISLIVCTLLTAVSFSASVGVSDFCYDAKPWIKSQIKDQTVNDYLIECIDNKVLSEYINKAIDSISKAKDQKRDVMKVMTDIEDYCKTNQCPDNVNQLKTRILNNLTELENRLKSISDLINVFKDLSDCKRINGNLNDILESLCTNGVKGVVMIFFNTIASSVCFAILVFSATIALR